MKVEIKSGILTLVFLVLLAMPMVYANSLSEGLIGYWKLDEGNGTAVNDTLNTYNGSITSTCGIFPDSYPCSDEEIWLAHGTGYATDLSVPEGSSTGTGAIDFGDNTSYYVGTEDFTLSYWSNKSLDSGSAGIGIAEVNPLLSGSGIYGFKWYNSLFTAEYADTIYVKFSKGTGFAGVPILEYCMENDNDWHNYLVMRNGSNMSIYVDGILGTENSCGDNYNGSIILANEGDVNITSTNDKHLFAQFTTVDDIGFWNRSLTDEEITLLSEGEIPTTTTTTTSTTTTTIYTPSGDVIAQPFIDTTVVLGIIMVLGAVFLGYVRKK